ncbi:uncharacterized protein LOC106162424 isoform X2 [Lingula anatina]|uniref:Uncharacterized protein LOC106162424 isoform X2 n=1 Tax=Lingula anatina TaxID=7574 RepID=A0A1S3IAI1_LINAN|nr:uncharacterized protein LOC106162424 isoform X2 [Lingula anatina]|eukprot:XP_013395173.1 uncharacterized protein LOC106162424 isoform X2 [Lingula anatina]
MATAQIFPFEIPRNEKENYFRMHLLLEHATDVLRDVLRTQLKAAYPGLFDPSKTDKLFDVLDNLQVKHTLLLLKNRKVRNSSQMKLLYPSGTPSTTVTTQDLDITLAVVLLRNITNLNPHAKWENPPASDTSIEANIGRVKTYRNQLSHGQRLGITDTAFQAEFNALKQVLLSLSPIYTSDDYDKLLIVPLDAKDFRAKFDRLCASGAVPVYRQRVAIVGPYGVGKTHLVKRLLQEEYDEETDAYTPGVKIYRHRCIVHKDGRSCWVRGKDDPEDHLVQHMVIGIQNPDAFRRVDQVDEEPPVKSRKVEKVIYSNTRESETETASFKIFHPDLVQKIKSVARGEPVDPEKQITIWDFGGQDVYYTTHQTFLSEQNIYLLVFRLDVNLDTKIPVYRGEKTVKEFIVYWLNSIHMHTVRKSKEKKSVIPHVLIIGTHKDKLASEVAADEILGQLLDYLEDKQELAEHVYRCFAISNLADVEEFDEIKSEIEHLCGYSRDREAGRQMHPVRWFQLELDLAKKSEERPIIYIKELRDMARLVGIRDAELDEMFIPYHHHLGDVLHFKVDGLENIVILDPQWLADLFSAIMTPPVSKSGKDRLDYLKRSLEKGELNEEVFDVYLQKEKMTDMKNEVIQLMEHFDLMLDISKSVQNPMLPSGKRKFVVPCMLKSNDLVKYRPPEKAREISLFISFPHGFFPPGLFHRLIIRLLRKYKPYHCVNGIPDVGFDHASFRLEDKTSVLHLFTAEKDIELVITNAAGPPKPHVYFNTRQTVENELSYLQKTYCPRMHFGHYIRVNHGKIPIEAETVLEKDVICVCVENAEVPIDLRPYRVWFSGEEAVKKAPLVARMRLSESNSVNHEQGRTEEKEKGLPHNQSLETASAQTSSTY